MLGVMNRTDRIVDNHGSSHCDSNNESTTGVDKSGKNEDTCRMENEISPTVSAQIEEGLAIDEESIKQSDDGVPLIGTSSPDLNVSSENTSVMDVPSAEGAKEDESPAPSDNSLIAHHPEGSCVKDEPHPEKAEVTRNKDPPAQVDNSVPENTSLATHDSSVNVESTPQNHEKLPCDSSSKGSSPAHDDKLCCSEPSINHATSENDDARETSPVVTENEETCEQNLEKASDSENSGEVDSHGPTTDSNEETEKVLENANNDNDESKSEKEIKEKNVDIVGNCVPKEEIFEDEETQIKTDSLALNSTGELITDCKTENGQLSDDNSGETLTSQPAGNKPEETVEMEASSSTSCISEPHPAEIKANEEGEEPSNMNSDHELIVLDEPEESRPSDATVRNVPAAQSRKDSVVSSSEERTKKVNSKTKEAPIRIKTGLYSSAEREAAMKKEMSLSRTQYHRRCKPSVIIDGDDSIDDLLEPNSYYTAAAPPTPPARITTRKRPSTSYRPVPEKQPRLTNTTQTTLPKSPRGKGNPPREDENVALLNKLKKSFGSSLSITIKKKKDIPRETQFALEQLSKMSEISATKIPRNQASSSRPAAYKKTPQVTSPPSVVVSRKSVSPESGLPVITKVVSYSDQKSAIFHETSVKTRKPPHPRSRPPSNQDVQSGCKKIPCVFLD